VVNHTKNIKVNKTKKQKLYKFLFFVMLFGAVLSFFTIILGMHHFDTSKLIAYCFLFLVFVGYSFFYRKQIIKLKK